MISSHLILFVPLSVLFCFTWSVPESAAIDGSHSMDSAKKVIIDNNGAIIRGDVSKKELAIVFTGDEFGDGAMMIREVLAKNNVKAAFFLTGNFYSNPAFKKVIVNLKKDCHYLGAHSDKHLLYADWSKRDSLLVTEQQFKEDLRANYKQMASFGISIQDTRYFLPPYEWYNSKIAQWTKQMNLQLINFSPGTRSPADYTYPEMGDRYLSSDQIYSSIFAHEKKDPHGLNGFILLIHIGTDSRRTDKFYHKLGSLIGALREKKYTFVRIDELLE
jgi:peptidoglycan/xylan/chitin deacetylase (PgdA/CDA1 family)